VAEPSLPEHIIAAAVITDAPTRFAKERDVVAVNSSWLNDGVPLDYERVYQCKDEDICCINLTSGTTGQRKGIALTHATVAGRAAYYGYSKGGLFARISRLFCSFGVPTTPGYTYLLYILSHGGTIYFSGSDIAGFLQYLGAFKVQGLVTSPYNLDGLLKFFEADSALESPFDVIICQGARLSRELSDRVRARMCQNLFTSYGSTETATCAFGPAEITSKIAGAVGFVCPGYTVDVVDSEGNVQSPGHEGSVRIRSPFSASSYIGDPEASARMFRDEAFYIGDRGYMTAEGMVVITGREKTALLVGGDSIAPEMVEEVLCRFPGIDQAAICAVDDALGISEIHALVVARQEIDEVALRSHCERHLRKLFVPESFIRVEELPRGGQGKIDRRKGLDRAK